jgi:hypothetical protein
MKKNDPHLQKTAQIWRAGGMIWMLGITMVFAVYDLYFIKPSIRLAVGLGFAIFAITIILFTRSLKTLQLAKKLPDEKFIDEVKRRKTRRAFLIVLIIEIAGFNIAPFALLCFNHIEYIVPVEILICAIHFIPLAKIFSMPVYYLLGGIVSAITILAILLVPSSSRIGNLVEIAAIPSICFVVLNWITITWILNEAMTYLKNPDFKSVAI